jgi:hypothetical protein
MARGETKGCEQDIECDCYSDRNDVVNVFSVNVQYINFIFVPLDSCPALLLPVKYSFERVEGNALGGIRQENVDRVYCVSYSNLISSTCKNGDTTVHE